MYHKKIYETGEMIQFVLGEDWYSKSQKGSHRHYQHPVSPEKMTIVVGRKTMPPKTAKRIFAMVERANNLLGKC